MGIAYPIIFLGLAIFGYVTVATLRRRYRGTGLDFERIDKEAIERLRKHQEQLEAPEQDTLSSK